MSQEEANGRLNYYDDTSPLSNTKSVDTLLGAIRHKTRGADVRESIARVMEVFWETANKSGNANMEVTQARGIFSLLKNRLDNIDAQLSTKADAAEVASRIHNIASAAPRGTYSTLNDLKKAKPDGDNGIYVVTADKKWYYWNNREWLAGGIYQSSSVSPYETFAFVAGNTPVNFNTNNKTINITGTNTYVLQGSTRTIQKGSIPFPSGSQWIVIDTTDNTVMTTDKALATQVVVGAIFNPTSATPHIFFNGYHTINDTKAITASEIPTHTGAYIFVGKGKNIVHDKEGMKLIFPACNVRIGKKSNSLSAFELNLPNGSTFIGFDTATQKVITGEVAGSTQVLLGYYDNNVKKVYLHTTSLATRIKKVACLGDSITEGVQASGWPWHRFIGDWCRKNSIEAEMINLGIGGTLVSNGVGNKEKAFVNRLETIPEDADVVVIFGGTNDWGAGAVLGDMSSDGTTSFYGAYKHILEWLETNRPDTKVMTMTPLRRYYKGSTTTWKNAQTEPNDKGLLLGDYVNAVKEVSAHYAVPCVDLHNESGINPVNATTRSRFIGDGLHPTSAGNKKMYPVILAKMKPLLEFD